MTLSVEIRFHIFTLPMHPVKRICLQYSSDYLSFAFIPSPQNCQLPMCLLCHQTLTNETIKPSHLKYHFEAKHSGKKDKPLSYFLQLSFSFKKQIQTFNMLLQETSKQENEGLIASYNIALLVTKSGKSQTIGETLLRPVSEEVLSTVMHEKPDNIMKKIPLSNNTISRRIDEMATDVKHQLINIHQRCEFSIQVDESTVVDNQCLMMVYVRYFSEDLQTCEEMLFTEKLPLD
ncbi:zinc finger BED domain-containing protein 5-like [Octopus sinensis]|uniref:Zinc finger BED domain-containing protein 5-like n=1 Tax=Octopus sinensis TaxID=2607531 RepID=A0A6P7SWW6_9MOLL|nr:zinc finger BED domain-containing protein 5-like [Octopus sinensis]